MKVSSIDYLTLINPQKRIWIENVFEKYNGFPTLNELWELMDKIWDDLGCSSFSDDKHIEDFYDHPIWILNTLFIEQDEQSLYNRKLFSEAILGVNPQKIADFGGGGATLSRIISENNSKVFIDVIEPFPSNITKEILKNYSNINLVSKVDSNYDIIVAIDVFEHVFDPVGLVYQLSNNVIEDGFIFTANCFEPFIKCHLSQNLHLKYSWDRIMFELGFETQFNTMYGTLYKKNKESNIEKMRKVEAKSKELYPYLKKIPNRLSKFIISIV